MSEERFRLRAFIKELVEFNYSDLPEGIRDIFLSRASWWLTMVKEHPEKLAKAKQEATEELLYHI